MNYNFIDKMGLESDSGIGSSMDLSPSRGVQEPESWHSFQSHLRAVERPRKSSSYTDLMMGKCTLEDVMREFAMNGTDSPYQPEEDQLWNNKPTDNLAGMGPSNVYLRQKSWPAPERSPAAPLPRPASWATNGVHVPMHIDDGDSFLAPMPAPAPAPISASTNLTEEQHRVLSSLPDAVVFSLLLDMTCAREVHEPTRKYQETPPELVLCKFCKSNGERESYYRSHALKDAAGRVSCPVLRAYQCRRCGARGDNAHTLKYCPLTSKYERIKSTAMMRTMASQRRHRRPLAPPSSNEQYVLFGEPSPSILEDNNVFAYGNNPPLDPLWAELEKKLMI